MIRVSINAYRLAFMKLEGETLAAVRELCELSPFKNRYYFYGTKEQMFDVLLALSLHYDIELF